MLIIRELFEKGGMLLFDERKRRVVVVTKHRMRSVTYEEFLSELKEELLAVSWG